MQRIILLVCLLAAQIAFSQKKFADVEVPAGERPARIAEGGVSILPSGRLVTPVGKMARVERSPFGLAINSRGSRGLILHHSGVVTVFDPNQPGAAVRVPSYDEKIKGLDNASFIGAAFDKDGQTAYLSGGDKGNVLIFNTKIMKK